MPARSSTPAQTAESVPRSSLAKPLPEISGTELDRIPRVRIHRARGPSQADLYALEWRGRSVVLKDLRARPWLVRVAWGRYTLARELDALLGAAHLGAAPRPLARLGRDAFLMERLRGKPLVHQRHGRPPLPFFDELGKMLHNMHAAGLAHGDLRRANIFVCDDGRPALLDFASAVTRRSGWRGWAHRIAFRWCMAIDRSKFARLKAAYYAGALTVDESYARENPPWYLQAGQFARGMLSSARRPWRLRRRRRREQEAATRTAPARASLK